MSNRRSFSLGLYLAGRKGPTAKSSPQVTPRPQGPVVWFHCRSARDMDHARTVVRQMQDDREQVSFVFTGTELEPSVSADGMIIVSDGPGKTTSAANAFLDHWRPDGLLWMGGEIDPVVLAATDTRRMKRFLVAAASGSFVPAGQRWLPGMRKALLGRFDMILANSGSSAGQFTRWGAVADSVHIAGDFEEDVPLLPCREALRSDFASVIGTRPVWLAVNAVPSEIADIADTHNLASRRSHRLLLIVSPRHMDDTDEIMKTLISKGISTVLRSDADPSETTRAIIGDVTGELGLWYRISPITYMGGTLTRGSRHPYEAAALGSVVVHGPITTPYGNAYSRLDGAGGAKAISNNTQLPETIESLLSPDAAARIASAAWEVTSQGAEVTNRITALINEIIDTAEN